MEWQQMLDTFARMPADERHAWWRVGAGLLALVVILLWLESRYFKRNQRVGSWAAVRLVSAVAVPLTFGVVWGPSRAIGGPEALGVFLLTLFTLAPLVWFGSHLLAGRWVRPALTRAESLALALTGLGMVAIPVMAFVFAQDGLRRASYDIGQRRELPAGNLPLEHTVQAVQRFHLEGVGTLYAQSLLAAPNTRLVRVEQRQGGQWPTDHSVAHPTYCTNGNDVHLLWPATEQPPYLRLQWAQSNGAIVKAEFTPQLPAGDAAVPFTIAFRPDGVDPVAPIPRPRAYLVLVKEGLTPYTQMLGSPPGAGEVRTTDCVLPGFKFWTHTEGWTVQAVGLNFYGQVGGKSLHTLIEKSP